MLSRLCDNLAKSISALVGFKINEKNILVILPQPPSPSPVIGKGRKGMRF
jgi:hypothetical protein